MRTVTDKMEVVNSFIDRSDAPIQTVSLAKELGIKVYHAAWPNDISGKIQKDRARGGRTLRGTRLHAPARAP